MSVSSESFGTELGFELASLGVSEHLNLEKLSAKIVDPDQSACDNVIAYEFHTCACVVIFH